MFPPRSTFQQLILAKRAIKITGPLMLDALHDEIYKLRRYREEDYGRDQVVDCFGSCAMRTVIHSTMICFYRDKYLSVSNFEDHSLASNCANGLIYTFPASGTRFSLVMLPTPYDQFDPALWFIDLANTTDGWDIIQPDRHLVIHGFSAIGYKD